MMEAGQEGGRKGGKQGRRKAVLYTGGRQGRREPGQDGGRARRYKCQEEGRAGGRQGRKDACQEGRKTFEMKDRRDVGQGFKGMREAR